MGDRTGGMLIVIDFGASKYIDFSIRVNRDCAGSKLFSQFRLSAKGFANITTIGVDIEVSGLLGFRSASVV